MIFGIDTASYQADPDFDRVKASGIAYVITKLTEGVGYVNPHAARTRAEAHRLGLGLGVYHFADAGDPAAEADHFLASLGPLGVGDVLALDWEPEHYAGDPVAWCLAWLTRVRAATGTAPLLYLNKTTLAGRDWSPVAGAGFGLWLAAYDFQPTVVPGSGAWPLVAVKQYSDRGVVGGVNGPVDLDTFFGTIDQFRAYGHQPGTTPAPPAPVVHPAPAPAPVPAPSAGAWDALPSLAYGQRGAAVLRLQQFLVRAFPAYARFTPTGFYGDQTATTLAEFQRRSGVTGGDGRNVGPQTKAALWAAGFRG